MLQKHFGDRDFLKKILIFAIPIIIQNFITNFVSLLDNIMVGQVGTVQMSGVSVANQLMLVFNLSVFGANSGAGIFTAQFHGSGNREGVCQTVRFKLMICLSLTAAAIAILIPGGQALISLYLKGDGDAEAAAQTLHYGYEYMLIMLLGFVPYALSSVYSSSMRECNESIVPMFSGVVAVLVNLGLNYVLIFGHFGAPAMGVQGAAVATVVSRYVELAILMVYAHTHLDRCPFAKGLYRSLYVPLGLAKQIFSKGMPLLLNEFLWSSGMAILSQCYSTCGLDVMPAINIADTVNNLSSVVLSALGNTVGIVMGQMMGAARPRAEIQDANRKLINLAILSGVLFGGMLAVVAALFPRLYNTTASVRTLAGQLILLAAVLKPLQSYLYCVYYTLRSGGKTWITFLYDCGVIWIASIPLAFCLSRFTGLPILPLYAICQSVDVAKAVMGFSMIRKGSWIQNLSKL